MSDIPADAFKIEIPRGSSQALMSMVEWLEEMVGKGQSAVKFRREPKTYYFMGSTFTHHPFVFARAEDAMMFKLAFA